MTDEPENYNVFERVTDRWPKLDDRLFVHGRDARVADEKDERNYRLLRGYKYAGDVLIQRALETRGDRDNLIYPAIFSYRHYIELALKNTIENYGDYAGVTFPKNHKLPSLWQSYLIIAEAFGNSRTNPDLITVGNCIGELNKMDSTSTVFRYALDVKGALNGISQSYLDLVNLHDVMNGIENFFECAEYSFSDKYQYVLQSRFEDF